MKTKRDFAYLVAFISITLCACTMGGSDMAPISDAAAQAADAPPGASDTLLPSELNTVRIVQQYGPSVVAVNVTVKGQRVNPLQNIPPRLRPFFRQLMPFSGQNGMRVERAAGSGFVVDGQGRILTNYHVVADALHSGSVQMRSGAQITVRFGDRDKEIPVTVVGTNQDFDLALLALKDSAQLPDNAEPIPLGDADSLRVGQKAIAIGNPFNLQATVSVGVVSAIQREQPALVSGVSIPFVQTDTAINPGSSGSPLLNSAGQVIGINDEILAPHGTSVGVGLAIPASIIKKALPDLKKGGAYGVTGQIRNEPRLGVAALALQEYPAKVRQYLELPDHGAMVIAIVPDGPADKAGLQPAELAIAAEGREWPIGGDVIVAVNGHELGSVRDLQKLVLEHEAGDQLKLTVWNHDEKREVSVTLALISREHEQGQQRARQLQ